MAPDQKVWFRAKTYGYGWGFPCSWQGWLVLIAYMLFVFGGSYVINPSLYPAFYLGYVIVLSILLTIVCYKKGEKPAWRWGRKE